MTKRDAIISVAGLIIILALIGWWADVFDFNRRNLVDSVERNMPAEDRKVFEDKLAALELRLNEKNLSDTDKFDIYMQIGNQYYSLGRLKEAHEAYVNASKINASNAIVWVSLYNVEAERGDYEAAEKSIQTALYLNSTDSEAWKKYIDVAMRLGRSDDEIDKIFNEAFFKTGQSLDIITAYARFLESKGDLQGALNYWRQALQRDAKNTAYQQEVKRLEALVKQQNQ